jgi:hypothetical protein
MFYHSEVIILSGTRSLQKYFYGKTEAHFLRTLKEYAMTALCLLQGDRTFSGKAGK